MGHADKNRYAIAAEGTYATDPSADGSGYKWMQIDDAPLIKWDRAMEPANYAYGVARHMGEESSADGASIPFSFNALGLDVAATDLAPTPTAADWQDIFITSCFGTTTDVNGDGIAAGGSTTTILTDSDQYNAEDLIFAQFGTSRLECRSVVSQAGAGPYTYTTTPAFTASPDATADTLGYRSWQYNETVGGSTLSIYTEEDARAYILHGGRAASLKLVLEPGKKARWETTLRFDSKERLGSVKASLPAEPVFTNPAIKYVLSTIMWGSTALSCKKVEIDWRLETMDVAGQDGPNGRGSIDVFGANPRITLTPAFATAFEDDFIANTKRTLTVQIGPGTLAGGRVSSYGFFAQAAQIKKVDRTADGKYLRGDLIIDVCHAGVRTGTTNYRYWTLGRT